RFDLEMPHGRPAGNPDSPPAFSALHRHTALRGVSYLSAYDSSYLSCIYCRVANSGVDARLTAIHWDGQSIQSPRPEWPQCRLAADKDSNSLRRFPGSLVIAAYVHFFAARLLHAG